MNAQILPPKIAKFIELAGGSHLYYKNPTFYYDLLTSKRGVNKPLVTYILENSEIITSSLKSCTIFDFFFDKVVKERSSISEYEFWLLSLLKIIKLLFTDESYRDIVCNKIYIHKLQSGMRNHTDLFKCLIDFDFEPGEVDMLVYSVIARDELDKLMVLSDKYPVAKFGAIFDTALRFGRFRIINYLINDLDLDPNDYGTILNLSNYIENHRYLYYTAALSRSIITFGNNHSIYGSKQDYVIAIKKILETYNHRVSLSTLDKWREIADSKIYDWEVIDFAGIVEILRPYVHEGIPLSHDFGKWNKDVFGKEWSNREHIIDYVKHLEEELAELREKYDILHDKYMSHYESPPLDGET